ncbi:hypothetical protein MUK42_14961 [Musa troglodytarum]|uniref:DUF3741 domain-containing protein n=1 Tax=Musa troglodytarum TaxID=320322 RepID=A0A9E7IAA9_9LILI|nr:hypothetical protein MUK42_14961 [Musa troglodytarum]
MGNVETMQASASRREVSSENRPATIGCMSGIIRLLCVHHDRSRKRLTSGKTKEKPSVTTPSGPTAPPPPPVEEGEEQTGPSRCSCETPGSPMIPQEIREPGAEAVVAASPETPRRRPALVARLMGLEDLPDVTLAVTPEAAADRRRELQRALEKCDEDLRALRRIIEAVRLAEIQAKAVSSSVRSAGLIKSDGLDARKECDGEQPSPVSVLDAISSPRYRSKRSPNGKHQPTFFVSLHGTHLDAEKKETTAVGSRIVKPSRMGFLFVGEQIQRRQQPRHCVHGRAADAEEINCAGEGYRQALDAAKSIEAMPWVVELKGREIMRMIGGVRRQSWRRRWRSSSREMAESVEEVWVDAAWEEEKWEVARIGGWMESVIWRDLVEELMYVNFRDFVMLTTEALFQYCKCGTLGI